MTYQGKKKRGGGTKGGIRGPSLTKKKNHTISLLSNFIEIDTFIPKVNACPFRFVFFSSSVFLWYVLRAGHI